MITLFISIACATIALVIILWAKKPLYHKNLSIEQTTGHLNALLKRGYNGAFIIIEDMNSDKFVQFAKYIKRKGVIVLELSFPRSPWSEQYYGSLKDWLRKEKIQFIIQGVDFKPVIEFLEVDY